MTENLRIFIYDAFFFMLKGDIIAWTKLSCAVSPTHGDAILSGHLVNEDESLKESQLPPENGIANALRSTSKFFVVLCKYRMCESQLCSAIVLDFRF